MTLTANRTDVVRVDDQHLCALAEFYRRVWDPQATIKSVRTARLAAASTNPVAPGEPPPTWLVIHGGVAIAHLTTIPIRLWTRGYDRPAYWMKGLWVLPEHRRSLAGFLVLRAAIDQLDEPSLALVHEPAAMRLFQAVGFTDLGALPNRLRLLRPGSLFRRLRLDAIGLGGTSHTLFAGVWLARSLAPITGPLAEVGLRAWTAAATGPLTGFDVATSQHADQDGIDALWRVVRAELRAGPVRDGRALARYVPQDGYSFVHVRLGSKLVAVGIVKKPRADGDPRLCGIRVATLSDLLYHPAHPRAGLAALRAAERVARAAEADALVASVSARTVLPVMRRRGYVRVPTNLRVLTRFPGEGASESCAISEWWFTRGDSGGDGSF